MFRLHGIEGSGVQERLGLRVFGVQGNQDFGSLIVFKDFWSFK